MRSDPLWLVRPMNLRRVGVVVLVLLAVASIGVRCPFGDEGPIQAGVCVVDITPVSSSLVDAYEAAFGGTAVVNHSDPNFVAGFGNDRRATGCHDRL